MLPAIEALPFEVKASGSVYIVVDRSDVDGQIRAIRDQIFDCIEESSSCLRYRPYFVNRTDDFKEKYGWNLLCPIRDPVTSAMLYIVGTYHDADDFVFAVSSLIDEAETQMRRFWEEVLIIAAAGDPLAFRKAVDKVFADSDEDEDGHTFRPFSSGSLAFCNDPESVASMDIDEDEDFDFSIPEGREYTPYRKAAVGAAPSAKRRNKVTAKDRKATFSNLPDRVSETFLKENARAAAIVNDTLENLSAEEIRNLLLELSKKHRNLLRGVYDTTLQGISKYKLILQPWSEKYSRRMKQKYHYCLLIKDVRGEETPVIFKHNPSFCIYVMYMLDRFNRKEDVTDLPIKNMEKEFCAVYRKIMDETDEKIAELFKGICSRTTKNGSLREGRYSEYIKDIHATFEDLMDNVNSIPFKVGFGRYLQVPPDKMTIPKELTELKFG